MTTFRVTTTRTSFDKDADYIESVVKEVANQIPVKRGWKIKYVHTLLDLGDGPHRATYLRVVNGKGVVQTDNGALVYEVSVTQPVQHRSVYNNKPMHCKCGSKLFYDLGRSLFTYTFQCAKCDEKFYPDTESGASK